MTPIKILLMTGLLAATTTMAQAPRDQKDGDDAKAAPASRGDLSDAEVRKIDKVQGKITLRHGAIKNLDMPPMTMVFAVKDRAMLDHVKPGDKVRFKAENAGGKNVVTEMVHAK